MKYACLIFLFLLGSGLIASAQSSKLLLQGVRLIDGTGSPATEPVDVLIEGGRIAAIVKTGTGSRPSGIAVKNLEGNFMMPLLISAHAHVGVLKGNSIDAANYTRDNILRQLKQYESYGIGDVLCMGTDRELIFPGFVDSSQKNRLAGARLFSAGHGFAVSGEPPGGSWTDELYRPATVDQVIADMDSLAALHPAVVKMWVDDFGGHSEKMKPEIYQAIIREAHRHGLRVAAHLFYLADARRLVDAGLDIIAHSIRDSLVDDDLLKKMKEKGVAYIPTLTRDAFTYIYAERPDWMSDAFFRNALEPGVYEMISSDAYRDKILRSRDYGMNKRAVEIAMQNLKRMADAGILVAMGTDSGADPARAQGFAEQYELELMVAAGLTPLQAIRMATANAARVLKIDNQYGTLKAGMEADFILLSASPAQDIRNTRKIVSVWKNGAEISRAPLPRN